MKTIIAVVSLLMATILSGLASVKVQEPANIIVGGSDSTGADAGLIAKSLNVTGVNTPSAEINSSVASVDMYITAVLGPVRANTNAFEAWSAATIAYMYQNGGQIQSNVIGGHKLLPAYITQTPAQTNNTIWFVIHVVSKDPNYKFLPSKLSFVGGSSDNSNYLATASSLASDPNYTYSPRFWGINWGSGGMRVNDTILSTPGSGKISEVPASEAIFIGAQLNYYMADYSAWIMGFSDYSVNGTWSLNDGTNTAHASITLHTKIIPSLPWLSLSTTSSTAVLGADMETNTTAILYSAPKLPPVWKKEGVMNSGDITILPKNPVQSYFKLVLQ